MGGGKGWYGRRKGMVGGGNEGTGKGRGKESGGGGGEMGRRMRHEEREGWGDERYLVFGGGV